MKLDFKTIALIILAAAFVLYIVFDKDPVQDTSVWKNEIARVNEKFKVVRDENVKLLAKINSDSVRRTKERTDHVEQVRKKDAVINDLKRNPEVITVIKENPLVGELITELEKRDSLKTERIVTLERDLSDLEIDVNKLTENFEEQIKLQSEKFTALEGQAAATEKELKKQKRVVKLLKIVSVVGTVGAFVLGSQ